MTEKRFLKLAQQAEEAKAEREALQAQSGGGGRPLVLGMLVCGVLMMSAAAYGIVVQNQGDATAVADTAPGRAVARTARADLNPNALTLSAIKGKLFGTREWTNKDLESFPPAPEGWTRYDFARIKDARIAKMLVERHVVAAAREPDRRKELLGKLIARAEAGMTELSAEEDDRLNRFQEKYADNALREVGGSLSTAVYTNGEDIFAISLIRFGKVGGAENAMMFAMMEMEKKVIEIGGREFTDRSQKTDYTAEEFQPTGDFISLSTEVDRTSRLTINGFGRVATVAPFIDATDFAALAAPAGPDPEVEVAAASAEPLAPQTSTARHQVLPPDPLDEAEDGMFDKALRSLMSDSSGKDPAAGSVLLPILPPTPDGWIREDVFENSRLGQLKHWMEYKQSVTWARHNGTVPKPMEPYKPTKPSFNQMNSVQTKDHMVMYSNAEGDFIAFVIEELDQGGMVADIVSEINKVGSRREIAGYDFRSDGDPYAGFADLRLPYNRTDMLKVESNLKLEEVLWMIELVDLEKIVEKDDDWL